VKEVRECAGMSTVLADGETAIVVEADDEADSLPA
jgi:hypothetical protein